MSKKMSENDTRRKTVTNVEATEFPSNYIKAKYMAGLPGKTRMMAGFEAGEPVPKVVIDRRTGKRKLKVEMNGYVRIEPNGDCFILDTLFNRLKLKALTQPGTIKIPRNTQGTDVEVRDTEPEFFVADRSIFDGLEGVTEEVIKAKLEKKGGRGPKLPPSSSIVPGSQVKKDEEGEKSDGADGTGGGRRPEMTGSGEDIKLDVE